MLSPTRFLRTEREFDRLYSKMITRVSDDHGLSKIEVDILLFLHNNPGCDTARDIVEMRGIAKSYVSKTVDLLLQKGLLMASEDLQDRRVSRLSVQKSAVPIVQEAKAAQDSLIRIIYRDFTEEEIEQLSSIFTKITKNIKEAL